MADSYRFVDALDAGDGFVYFVAVHHVAGGGPAETRLVRLCRDDVGNLDSYAEVKLSCVPPTAAAVPLPLSVAVSAHVAPVGADLAWRIQLEAGEPAIYLVAERQGAFGTGNTTGRWDSGVCVYSMRQVISNVDCALRLVYSITFPFISNRFRNSCPHCCTVAVSVPCMHHGPNRFEKNIT